MKQKMVIKLQMEDAKKRSKAMKLAVGLEGVLSASIKGAGKDKMVVVGNGVDSVALTTLLRKNMGFAELISVKTLKEEEEEEEEPAESVPVFGWSSYGGGGGGRGGYPPPQYQYYVNQPAPDHYQDPSCCVM